MLRKIEIQRTVHGVPQKVVVEYSDLAGSALEDFLNKSLGIIDRAKAAASSVSATTKRLFRTDKTIDGLENTKQALGPLLDSANALVATLDALSSSATAQKWREVMAALETRSGLNLGFFRKERASTDPIVDRIIAAVQAHVNRVNRENMQVWGVEGGYDPKYFYLSAGLAVALSDIAQKEGLSGVANVTVDSIAEGNFGPSGHAVLGKWILGWKYVGAGGVDKLRLIIPLIAGQPNIVGSATWHASKMYWLVPDAWRDKYWDECPGSGKNKTECVQQKLRGNTDVVSVRRYFTNAAEPGPVLRELYVILVSPYHKEDQFLMPQEQTGPKMAEMFSKGFIYYGTVLSPPALRVLISWKGRGRGVGDGGQNGNGSGGNPPTSRGPTGTYLFSDWAWCVARFPNDPDRQAQCLADMQRGPDFSRAGLVGAGAGLGTFLLLLGAMWGGYWAYKKFIKKG